jgi:hypothetical protein
MLLDAPLTWAGRCRLATFVKLGKTSTNQRAGIETAIQDDPRASEAGATVISTLSRASVYRTLNERRLVGLREEASAGHPLGRRRRSGPHAP